MTRWIVALTLVLVGVLVPSRPALAAPPPSYPPTEWVPAAAGNYASGRADSIRAIVIHETETPASSAIFYFRNPTSGVSAHYLVRAWDGGILQFVAESDTAFHARGANAWTIGIEHEFA